MDGQVQISNLSYRADGALSGGRFANGQTLTGRYDLADQLTEHPLARLDYDAAGRIVGLTHSAVRGNRRSF